MHVKLRVVYLSMIDTHDGGKLKLRLECFGLFCVARKMFCELYHGGEP